MSDFSWNIRGFNKTRKHQLLRDWLFSSSVSFGCILETRVQEINVQRIHQSAFPGWDLLTNYEHHRLGRIWVIWKDSVVMTPVFKSSQVITCSVSIPEQSLEFFCSFVYASNFERDRETLWADLSDHHDAPLFSDKPWLIMGDFNEVLDVIDHSSSSFNVTAGSREFQRFTNHCGIMDLAKSGTRYTWTNKQQGNPISKRIDRALISDSWLQVFPNSYAFFEAGGCSDHARCVVHLSGDTTSTNTRKPFKFVNVLTENANFLPLVESYWAETDRLFVSTSAIFRLAKKLKGLKLKLKELSRNSLGNLTKRAKEAFSVLCDKQQRVLDCPSRLALEEEAEASSRWNYIATLEEGFLKQKSKIHWLKLGDQNNKYFHKQAEARRSKNAIRIIQLPSGVRKTDQQSIKDEAVRHFQEHLQHVPSDFEGAFLEELQSLLSFRCPPDIGSQLTCEVSPEEIKRVLFAMPTNKAPGPDGYSVEFFKAAWSVIGEDFIVAVQSFFIKGFLPHGVNSTILTLIPKKDEVFEMRDYRPIACCNVIYKVISKIVANRLKETLPLFISDNQSAFIKDRLLLENVLLASELVQGYHLPGTSERCAIKFDISKAFDSIQWSFIQNLLRAMNFPEVFVRWVYLCISTPSFSVQVNGELAGYFRSNRGIRQGCALSPYLFVICMNVLSAMLDKSAVRREFGFHPKCREEGITHLCFADDIMVFTDGKFRSIEGVSKVFDKFAVMSGLKINKEKTSLFLAGNNEDTKRLVSGNLGYRIDTLPIRYLGLPLLTRRMSTTDYTPLLEKIKHRMENWSSRYLSFAGRYQLISSVISGIIQFWAAAFWIPRECIREIERLCSGFLWSGGELNARKAKIPWKDICFPHDEGGLGFRDIKEANLVYGLKLLWKILTDGNSLWVRWVKKRLLKGRTIWTANPKRGSWIWRNLLKLRETMLPFTRRVVNDGNEVDFWYDNWTNHGRLLDVVGSDGPRRLGISLQMTVKEAVEGRNVGRVHRDDNLNVIEDELANLTLTEGRDVSLWRHGDNIFRPDFSTKKTWEQTRKKQVKKSWSKGVWFANSVPKHSFIVWLTVQNKLSTMDRIIRWMPTANKRCILCSTMNETRDHLFFRCSFARKVWNGLARSMMGSGYTSNWSILIQRISRQDRDTERKFLLQLVFQSSVYHIWWERNNRRHNNISTTPARLQSQIDKSVRNKLSALRTQDEQHYSKMMIKWFSFKT